MYGFHEFHAYRSGECTKALFSEMSVMTPRDSTGVMSDNDFQRTGVIYPSTVSNSLWALSTKVGTTDSKLVIFLFFIVLISFVLFLEYNRLFSDNW